MAELEPTQEQTIERLRQLLDDNIYEIKYEITGLITYDYNYYDFKPEISRDIKNECYKAMIDFFLLDVSTFIQESDICEKLHKLFTHPTEPLIGKMMNNQLVASYIVLDFTVFCMAWVESVFTSDKDDEYKLSRLDSLVTGLNGYDNGYSFITSTLGQLFYYTKDPSSPLGIRKDYRLVTAVLSSCITIQRNLRRVGILKQLYTFACNRIVSLYIERIGNPKTKPIYTSDFVEDRVPWRDYVLNKSEPGTRLVTMKKKHQENKYIAPLLELLSYKRPGWKGGDSNKRSTHHRTSGRNRRIRRTIRNRRRS